VRKEKSFSLNEFLFEFFTESLHFSRFVFLAGAFFAMRFSRFVFFSAGGRRRRDTGFVKKGEKDTERHIKFWFSVFL